MKKLFLSFWVLVLASQSFGARDFVRASSQFIECSTTTLTAYPISMSAWFQTDDLTTNQVLVANTTSVTGIGVYMIFRGANAGDPLTCTDYDGTTGGTASSAGSVTTNTWFHGGAVFAGASSRAIYLNGAKDTNSTTTSNNLAGTDKTNMGALISGNSHLSGKLAEVAIWNVALTDDEMLSLSYGVSPLRIRPSALVFYAPLWGNTILDYVGRKSLVNQNGSTESTTHPRRYK